MEATNSSSNRNHPNRRSFVTLAAAGTAAAAAAAVAEPPANAARIYWLGLLDRIAGPVLSGAARGRLHAEMPIEHHPASKDRPQFSHLEAIGRTLTGIAPWLELGATNAGSTAEQRHRASFVDLARAAIARATDPASPDYCNFDQGQQPLVDAAFLAQALLRAPNQLWAALDQRVRANVIAALIRTRRIQPGRNNWLLFASTIEAFLARAGEQWNRPRVEAALTAHEQWFKGDGHYGDGPSFHWDYYNSFVIHPMLLDTLAVFAKESPEWSAQQDRERERAIRYAAIQERLISPEGTYPIIGRSIAYRMGAFHLLSQMALRKQLPGGVTPAQVRSALTAVMKRQMERPGTFDPRGWLTIGVAGHQPGLGETYISTGSLYLCCAAFLPLGLPEQDEFWSAPDADWTAKRLWSGADAPADHAVT